MQARLQVLQSPNIVRLDLDPLEETPTVELASLYDVLSAIIRTAQAEIERPVHSHGEGPGSSYTATASRIDEMVYKMEELSAHIVWELASRPNPDPGSNEADWRKNTIVRHAVACGQPPEEIARIANGLR